MELSHNLLNAIKQAGGEADHHFRNWAETFSCVPAAYFEPATEEELLQVLTLARQHRSEVRVVGRGHSPSDLACTSGFMVSLHKLDKVLEVDEAKRTITVQAGMTFTDLNEVHLPQHNLGLSVLGSISDLTVGGALSTATHGTGIFYGNFCTTVLGLELVTGEGHKLSCSRSLHPEVFKAALCGLGALGVVTSVTLQCEPAFCLQRLEYPASLDQVLKNLSSLLESCQHFRFNWFPHTNRVVVTQTSRTSLKPESRSLLHRCYDWVWNYGIGYYTLELFYWISTFLPALVPFINQVFFSLLHDRAATSLVDISHRLFNIECLFRQNVTEWAIPLEQTGSVLQSLRTWVETSKFPCHFPVEVRFCQADDVPLSPCYGRPTCFINIITYRPYGKFVPYREYWNHFEKLMLEAGGRPHWAKEHGLTSQTLRKLYPEFDSWCEVRRRLDPTDMFCNSYLRRILS